MKVDTKKCLLSFFVLEYGMILQDNPSNWEAAFFQVYYQAKQCTIANIPSAANSVVNSINSTLSMVSKIQDEKEKSEALDTIINYSISIATVFYSSAHSFRLKTNAQSKQLWDDCVQNIASSYSIYQTLEIMLKQFFSNDNKRINTNKIRKEKIMGEAMLQKLRQGQMVSWATFETICGLLDCQPADLIEYQKEGDVSGKAD